MQVIRYTTDNLDISDDSNKDDTEKEDKKNPLNNSFFFDATIYI